MVSWQLHGCPCPRDYSFLSICTSEDGICEEVWQCSMHLSQLIQTLPLELAHCQNYSFTWDSWVVSRDNSRRISVTGNTAWMCSAHFWIKRAHLHLSLVKKKKATTRDRNAVNVLYLALHMPGSKSTQNSSARNVVKLPKCDWILECECWRSCWFCCRNMG